MTGRISIKKQFLAVALVGIFAVSNIPTNAIAETSSPAASPGVTITNSATLNEGGSQSSFEIVLDSEPTDTVEVKLDHFDGQLQFPGGNGVCFIPSGASTTPGSPYEPCNEWDVPKSISVEAIDDNSDEGNQIAFVYPTVQSSDSNYNLLALNNLSVQVIDNDHLELPLADLELQISLTTQGNIASDQDVNYLFALKNNGPGNYQLRTQDSGGDDSGIYVIVPASFDIPVEKGSFFDSLNENIFCLYLADANDFDDPLWDNYGNSRVLICTAKNSDISISTTETFSFTLRLTTNQTLLNNTELLAILVVEEQVDQDMLTINQDAQDGKDVFHNKTINNISQAVYQVSSSVGGAAVNATTSPSKIAARSTQLPTTGASSAKSTFIFSIAFIFCGCILAAMCKRKRLLLLAQS